MTRISWRDIAVLAAAGALAGCASIDGGSMPVTATEDASYAASSGNIRSPNLSRLPGNSKGTWSRAIPPR